MLAALQIIIYCVTAVLSVIGILLNIVVLNTLSRSFGPYNTSWGYGYFPFGGLVVMATAWPPLLLPLVGPTFRQSLTAIAWVAGVIYVAPILLAFWKPIRERALDYADTHKGWSVQAKEQ